MATYAIGDVQGCHAELQALLALIEFRTDQDSLWFTGDLVNRGPDSLAVLRFVRALGDRAITVLGNHDLHLLACRFVPGRKRKIGDTLDEVLAAADCDDLLTWLRHRPLVHFDDAAGFGLVHAGLAPSWSFTDARQYATELEASLRGPRCSQFLGEMYGSGPAKWDPALAGMERLRFLTNCFTRMRYCSADGALNLKAKGGLNDHESELVPWFMLPQRASRDTRIVFGHWSTLRLSVQQIESFNVFPLDTGAVWGGELTAMRLDDGARFAIKTASATSDAD